MTKEELFKQLQELGFVEESYTNPTFPFLYSANIILTDIFFYRLNTKGWISPWLFKWFDNTVHILKSDHSMWIPIESMPIPSMIALYK